MKKNTNKFNVGFDKKSDDEPNGNKIKVCNEDDHEVMPCQCIGCKGDCFLCDCAGCQDSKASDEAKLFHIWDTYRGMDMI